MDKGIKILGLGSSGDIISSARPTTTLTRTSYRIPVIIDTEELGARLGALEMEGYVKTKTEMEIGGNCLPNGISAAGLTGQGKRVLSGPRW